MTIRGLNVKENCSLVVTSHDVIICIW